MPPDESGDPKGPWLYTGGGTPTPTPPPAAAATPPVGATPQVGATPPAAPPAILPQPLPRPPAAPRPAATKVDDKKSDPSLAGIVDTIEAIIIALILALTFRAFIVEAFVIPTGSMAPTLLGAHFKVICPKCGYEFDLDAGLQYQYRNGAIFDVGPRTELTSNTNIPADPADGHSPPICPNCNYVIDYKDLPQTLGNRTVDHDERPGRLANGIPRQVPFAWANNGDRILVLKYLYSILPPQRWDVIVFKEPQHAQDNYIKRLIGLPGETVEIINGDIYIGPPGAPNDPENRVIARKPSAVQQAVWQLVYDNDYYPIDEGKPRLSPPGVADVWRNPWVGAGDGWSIHGPIISYGAGQQDAKAGDLRFASREPYGLNTLGYNNDVADLGDMRQEMLYRVGDLRLETVWTPTSGDAPGITLTAGLPSNCVQAHWVANTLELSRLNLATGKFDPVIPQILKQFAAPVVGKSYAVALENVDRTTRLFINGEVAAQYDMPWTAADARRQAVADRAIPPESASQLVHVEVSGPATLAHLKLSRDLFYTQSAHDWPVHTANTDRPLTLGPDEFFPMGDNSRKSSDGRYWNDVYPALDDLGTRRGIVPRRYLLGKAFFVYWPSGFRATSNDAIPVLSNLPLVPDTGDMRLIR